MKTKLFVRTLVLCLCLLVSAVFSAAAEGAQLSGSLIRLHVVADTGSEEDLRLKNAVRDAILAEFFSEPMESLQAERDRVEGSLTEIRQLAEETLRGLEADCNVQVSFGMRYLPEKEYESFSLPAGRYETLTVTIGRGKGSNWWCVLYPPLCVVPAAALQETAENAGIPQDGYEMMTGDDEEIRFRFKILEILTDLDEKIFGR
ncbi:MAG: stage II sporulation protein R [Clostridia bacterium]|nr:stage II sporulation protein R [Clostridia bacterium]